MMNSRILLTSSTVMLFATTACPSSFAETPFEPTPVIQSEPTRLDPSDPRYGPFFAAVKRKIADGWRYPCINVQATRECEYKSTRVIVEFGILRDGRLAYTAIRQSSGILIYDDRVLDAIKSASPFPPPPPALTTMRSPEGTASILAEFHYDSRPFEEIIRGWRRIVPTTETDAVDM